MITVNYRQMLAAKAVYKDTNEDVIDAVYRCCGPNAVVDIYERGAELLIKCTNGSGIFRVYDRESKIVHLEDILSFIVIGNPERFVIDQMPNSISVTLVASTEGDMKEIIKRPMRFGLGHLKIGMLTGPISPL